MFVQAIETAAQFTRAIHTISRNYGSTDIQAGAATLFFINVDGWAYTCKHVAQQLEAGGTLQTKAEDFKKELSARLGETKKSKLLRELEKKYGYSKKSPFELHNRFMDCIDGNLGLKIIKHSKVDAALIKFEGYTQLKCNSFPVFPSDSSDLKQGIPLCRLGFPFPEFTNYAYNDKSDTIEWTTVGRVATPRFPIEGMVTRRILGPDGNVYAFEMSTPGLRGQSGGPAFDMDGKVWGMQFATAHLDLNFDVEQEVLRGGTKKLVKDSAFLHVGACIHIDVLKSFMRDNNVQFAEG